MMSVSIKEWYDKRMTKQCTKCKKVKSVISFFSDQSKHDGLYSSCRECSSKSKLEYNTKNRDKARARSKKWRLENPGKATASSRRYISNNKEKIRERGREYYRLNSDARKKYQREAYKEEPAKIKARVAVYQALKSGKLNKPIHCDNCSQKETLEAHHHDYSRKLDVLWLCKSCHGIKHRKAGVPFQSVKI